MSPQAVTTYVAVAKQLDIELCTSCAGRNHARGEAEISIGRVHWADRHVTHPGLRNFLKLVSGIYLNHQRGQPRWQILWEGNVWAYRKAREEFRVLIPANKSKHDRARARKDMKKQHARNAAAWKWTKEIK